VIFGWVLDGRAVQGIWTWRDKDSSGERELGTTVRFFDPKIDKWRIVWIDPVSYAIKILLGGSVGDRIVLEGTSDDGVRMRWSFNDIRKDSFIWRGEKSRDDGRTWRLTDEYHLKRRSAAPSQNVKALGHRPHERAGNYSERKTSPKIIRGALASMQLHLNMADRQVSKSPSLCASATKLFVVVKIHGAARTFHPREVRLNSCACKRSFFVRASLS
jgi:hypothetical protein